MTDEEILAEAKRLQRRADYIKNIDEVFSGEHCYVTNENRFDSVKIDVTGLGMLRAYLIDQYDAKNPPSAARQNEQ